MRAREFIKEESFLGGTKKSTVPKSLKQASQGVMISRDVGGYDRTYHLNRIWMACAMADGSSNKAVDMPSASFVEKYNVAFPYTDVEHMMVLQAMATIPTDGKELEKRSKSEEPEDTYKVSPVAQWNKKEKKISEEAFSKSAVDAIPNGSSVGVKLTDPGPANYYWKYRTGLAAAFSPDTSDTFTPAGPAHDDMVMIGYTSADQDIIDKAHKIMGWKPKKLTSNGSKETDGTYTISPVANWNKTK